jgi:putative ABC transport system ATP-binding protein
MIIEAKSLYKTYGSKDTQVNALRGVNIAVNKGDFIALVGPSGCGKSTLLHILGAMDSPNLGEVLLEDRNILKFKSSELTKLRLNRIGFIFQTFNLIPTLDTFDNVMLPMKLAGIPKKKAKEKTMLLLKKVGLEDRKGHVPAQLSGGQKQRVAIARALANDPAIILADEPTGNLDSESGEAIMKILEALNKDGHTIIMVTHNYDLAERAGRIIKMKDGQVFETVNK